MLTREKGNQAELKWDANAEKRIAGYHVYKLQGTWGIVRVTEEPIKTTTLTHKSGPTRFWVVAVDALGRRGNLRRRSGISTATPASSREIGINEFRVEA